MDNNLLYEKDDTTKNYLTDSFYINSQKPLTLSQKIKNKVIKYSKPFGLGIGAYLSFELVKNLFVKTSDLVSTGYAYSTQLLGGWFDSINVFLLNAGTQPANYHCYGILQLSTGCSAHRITSITEVINIVSYTTAAGFVIKSFIKFKEYKETKGNVPISHAITFALVGAILLALPTLFIITPYNV